MIQDYCEAFIERHNMIETCGRVMPTSGVCDNESKHATLVIDDGRKVAVKNEEAR